MELKQIKNYQQVSLIIHLRAYGAHCILFAYVFFCRPIAVRQSSEIRHRLSKLEWSPPAMELALDQ